MSDGEEKVVHSFRISEGVLKSFKDMVVERHGQLRYHLSDEVEKALREYLHAHRQEAGGQQQHHLSKQDFLKSQRPDRRRRLESAERAILNDYADREYVRGSHMRAILINSTGCKDPRTLKKYIHDLVIEMGVINCYPFRKLADFDTERYVIAGG